jgi:hypothetical protein
MRKVKYFVLTSVILGGLFFLFGPEVFPENFQPQEILSLAQNADVIIIFNSGGWGDTPFEKAEDFAPIIEGIQETLEDLGYNSLVIPYKRTKNDFLGKIAGAKDFLNSFKSSSKILAEKIEFLTENLPDKKIIIAGLSAGGALVDETLGKVSPQIRVYAIAAGIPFWHNNFESENILLLDNNGKDSLAKGDIKSLISALVKTPFKWIFSKLNGENLTFSQALQAPGHEYSWSSPEVSSQIVTFLENKVFKTPF